VGMVMHATKAITFTLAIVSKKSKSDALTKQTDWKKAAAA